MAENYQRQLDNIIASLSGKPTLLLHSCCGPCSSYVLEYLTQYFEVTLAYYNPNIEPAEEYQHRLSEQVRLLKEGFPQVGFVELPYDNEAFHSAVSGFESLGEGSERCYHCFQFRLQEIARYAGSDYDYFTTTLTVSPHKNAQWINEIGFDCQGYGAKFLPSDFKKREGYKRSIALSKQFNLYRQEYCGCAYSLAESKEV